MKRILPAVIALVLGVAAMLFAYERLNRSPAGPAAPNIAYASLLGVPGDYSPYGRLPELPLDIVLDQARGRIVSRQENGEIVSWDLQSGKARVIARTDALFGFCRAAQRLIVSAAGQVTLLDLDLNLRRVVASGAYDHVAWRGDCARFALAGAESKAIEIWQADYPARLAVVDTAAPVRNGLAMSEDGRYLAAAQGTYVNGRGHETNLEVFEITDAGITRTLAFDDPSTIVGLWRMAFAAASRSLIVGAQVAARSGLRSFSARGGGVNWGHDGFASYWVRGLAVSPDGRLLVTGDEKGLLRAWDAATGENRFEGRTGLVIQAVTFSEDGRRLAIALWDSTIAILDTRTLVD